MVADLDVLNGCFNIPTIANDVGGFWAQIEEFSDGGGCLTSGARFEQPTEQDEGDDHGGGVEVGLDILRAEWKKDYRGAVKISGESSRSDQAVHVGCAMAQCSPGAFEKTPATQELNRCYQCKEQYVNVIWGDIRAPHGASHASRHDECGEDCGGYEQRTQLAIFKCAFDLLGVFRNMRRGFVTRTGDGIYECVYQGGIVMNRGLMGGKVDLHICDARDGFEGILNPRHTRGTTHAFDGEGQGLHGVFGFCHVYFRFSGFNPLRSSTTKCPSLRMHSSSK